MTSGGAEQLRVWRLDDAADLVAARASHLDLDRQMPPLPDQIAARRWIRERELDPWGFFFAVVLTDESGGGGRAVGQVALSRLDPPHGSAWLSYWLAGGVRGRGLASRAAATVADWALDVLGLHRLELGHRTDNLASARVAERAGFVPEGLEREKFCYDGVRHDVRVMARLVTDPRPPAYTPIRLVPPTTSPVAQ